MSEVHTCWVSLASGPCLCLWSSLSTFQCVSGRMAPLCQSPWLTPCRQMPLSGPRPLGVAASLSPCLWLFAAALPRLSRTHLSLSLFLLWGRVSPNLSCYLCVASWTSPLSAGFLWLSLSLTLTPYTPVQSGREALTTGSQGVHPEAPKNFLALTLVTKAMQFWGGGGAQCRLAHKEDTLWQNNNNNYNNNIIHPGQTQLPQANCTVQVSG